jgi:hypothetical protein
MSDWIIKRVACVLLRLPSLIVQRFRPFGGEPSAGIAG